MQQHLLLAQTEAQAYEEAVAEALVDHTAQFRLLLLAVLEVGLVSTPLAGVGLSALTELFLLLAATGLTVTALAQVAEAEAAAQLLLLLLQVLLVVLEAPQAVVAVVVA